MSGCKLRIQTIPRLATDGAIKVHVLIEYSSYIVTGLMSVLYGLERLVWALRAKHTSRLIGPRWAVYILGEIDIGYIGYIV